MHIEYSDHLENGKRYLYKLEKMSWWTKIFMKSLV